MKRFAWLMLFPYVVQFSSTTMQENCRCPDNVEFCYVTNCDVKIEQEYVLPVENDPGFSFYCRGPEKDCEWLYDLAEAMNNAHERRRAKTIKAITEDYLKQKDSRCVLWETQ